MEQKLYAIEITETLQKTIQVYAPTPEDAMSRVREMHQNGGIVLGSDDFVEVTFGQRFDEKEIDPPRRRPSRDER